MLDEFKTTHGFLQADEIANVLPHAADMQSIVCIWHTRLICWQVVKPGLTPATYVLTSTRFPNA